ncbi:metallophosphoesterase [Mycobacteroides abscessus]|uniref:metallophosphoesterase n=1 Tax=Mycobacteroides abscessus TaxID=36809 RepID=UPI0009A64413|nr:metallophosphoesterase [Mycobacteroides abscessus]MDO3066935.1 metallophosphoesterase [Mycobacteroides abscessus subsp. bolletii]SKN29057.1 diadenosine tetraphosphatase [Mycobacteroides abscessus subsp. bolletii]SKX03655.1 diadenosine tetraphosphatase [Mycobacteroides abscessus subsp. bolletii]
MTIDVAIVGDIHGNSTALKGMLSRLSNWTGNLVFIGDYVNRGTDSAGVIQLLADLSKSRPNTFFIAGNHDTAFLEAVNSGHLFPFLSIGGAATVRSYVKTPKGDVGDQLRRNVPKSHVEFLNGLIPSYKFGNLVVAHDRKDTIFQQESDSYQVYGHTPTDDGKPHITANAAGIDTGCGLSDDGPLTCFFWPSQITIQIDPLGTEITT